MKRFILAAAMLLLAHFGAQATVVTNTTGCSIDLKQICYDATCGIVSVNIYTITSAGSITLSPPCPAGTSTAFEVCWTDKSCPIACPYVAGPGGGSCATSAFSNPLPPCGPCAPIGGNVTYDPVLDTLDIY